MDQLRVRPMSAAEFKSFRARVISSSAAGRAHAGDWAADQAGTLAAQTFDNLLPAGPRTAGMLLLTGEKPNGEPVGYIWVALNRSRPGNAWICEFEVSPEHQGKGYGYALAEAAELQARQQGADMISGHVYTNNAVTRHIAETLGYEETAVVVRKRLGGTRG